MANIRRGSLSGNRGVAKYVVFSTPRFPDRVAFLLGGELRGYLFTKYINIPRKAAFFLSNLYFNIEYAIVSKYCYTREPYQHYEYVREEYKEKFDPANPPTTETINKINRTGNFIGYMYGNNADSVDIAIGWRNDLQTTPEYSVGYQADVYFDSLKKKKYPDRLFKMQLHYRFYRLGDERNVISPYYSNENYWFEEDKNLDTNGDGIPDNDSLAGVGGSDATFGGSSESGSTRRTEFLRVVKMFGNILDFYFYSDILRISRFVLGFESNLNFYWNVYNPLSSGERVEFDFKFEFAFVVSW
ncbi:MAG TPA: hypothetical protein PLO89_02780 [Spirochaetota bacterium]|nr:hypothetical protein [Spirochaetota bacterium]